MPIVMKYGLLAPTEGAEHVKEILLEAHTFREALIEVEIDKRANLRAAYRLDDTCRDLERAAIEASKKARGIRDDLRRLKGRRGHLRAVAIEYGDNDMRAQLAEEQPGAAHAREILQSALKQAYDEEKAAILAWHRRRRDVSKTNSAVVEALQRAQQRADDAAKACAAASDLHAATKEIVIAACRKAFSDRPLYDYTWPNDPEKHEEFDGRGRIALRFTKATAGGIPVPAVFDEGCSHVVIARPQAPTDGQRVGRKDLRVLRLRLGKDKWASWPMVLHRMPPNTGNVLGVTVCSRKDGDQIKWHVTFTIENGLPEPSKAHGDVAVVDIGWRLEDDGAIHAATIWSEGGDPQRIVLSNDDPVSTNRGKRKAGVINRLRYADRLRQTGDDVFNSQVESLCRWVDSLGDEAPEWLQTSLKDASHWRSHGRLHELMDRWAVHRFDADADDVPSVYAWMDRKDLELYGRPGSVFVALRAWQRKDHHLWVWEHNQRSAACRQRMDIYRNVAAKMAADYRVVVMAKQDLSVTARKRKPNDDVKAPEAVRRARVLAAPYELRQAIEQAMVKSGGRVEYASLGKDDIAASATDLERCAGILSAWKDPARKDEIKSVFAQKKESMWARLKRTKAEKEAAKEGTRKADDKAAE